MTRHCLLGEATLIQSPWLWLATMTLGKWFDSLSVFIPVMIQKGRLGLSWRQTTASHKSVPRRLRNPPISRVFHPRKYFAPV